ncbi:SAM-dependent methyltransferase, partial [Paenibacillus darwinianus]
MARKVNIIGIGDDGGAGLPPAIVRRIGEADVLVGGERQLAFFPEFAGRRIVLKGGLSRTAEELADLRQESDVVVLASGDPLFFGIAGYLANKLGRDAVEIHSQ